MPRAAALHLQTDRPPAPVGLTSGRYRLLFSALMPKKNDFAHLSTCNNPSGGGMQREAVAVRATVTGETSDTEFFLSRKAAQSDRTPRVQPMRLQTKQTTTIDAIVPSMHTYSEEDPLPPYRPGNFCKATQDELT
ncbi:GMC oxidoreductase [Apiospora arundinis]